MWGRVRRALELHEHMYAGHGTKLKHNVPIADTSAAALGVVVRRSRVERPAVTLGAHSKRTIWAHPVAVAFADITHTARAVIFRRLKKVRGGGGVRWGREEGGALGHVGEGAPTTLCSARCMPIRT